MATRGLQIIVRSYSIGTQECMPHEVDHISLDEDIDYPCFGKNRHPRIPLL